MSDEANAYLGGFKIGMNACGECADLYEQFPARHAGTTRDISAGLLVAVISTVYLAAPSEDDAMAMIEFAIMQSKDARKERESS